ncbi:unnamed protein product [Rotaria sp. Silwood1]|nr:unnamed protein product [Rotaria sp. Silwood1]CAF1205879.1 unnamed protein product [Rotaria sp. Silwood1]CAF1209636.1 unnamed protein product [Rotaria sp. Silwood1]
MSNKDDESIEMLYSKSCLDLNMDIETKLDPWRSYEHIRKHYVLEGDQLHCCCLNDLCSNDGSIIDKLYDLVERLNECEYSFNSQYDLIENVNKINRKENPSGSFKSRFDLSLKLFYYSIENILTIGEKNRLISNEFNSLQIQQSFQ